MTVDQNVSTVKEYLKKTNRPYSVVDLYNNIKSIPKSKIINALNDLVESKAVTQKTYGKQSVFVFNQQEIDIDQKELTDLQGKIKGLQEQFIPDLKKDIAAFSSEYNTLAMQLTDDEAREKLKSIEIQIMSNDAKLISLKSSSVALLTPVELKKIDDDTVKFAKMSKKYKRICMNLINTLSESTDKKVQDLTDELGLEIP